MTHPPLTLPLPTASAPPPRIFLNAGGAGHRKLIFDLANGEVHLRFAEQAYGGT